MTVGLVDVERAAQTRPFSHAYELFILVLTVLSLIVMVAMLMPLDDSTINILQFYDNLMCFMFLIDFTLRLSRSDPRSHYFIKERGVSFIGADGPNDVSPSGLPQGVGLHQLALVAMGVSIFDNLDFERAVEEARRLNRYEFLFMAAPLRVEKGTGSPLNPLAIF